MGGVWENAAPDYVIQPRGSVSRDIMLESERVRKMEGGVECVRIPSKIIMS